MTVEWLYILADAEYFAWRKISLFLPPALMSEILLIVYSAIRGSRLTTDPHKRTWTNWVRTWVESVSFDLRLMYVRIQSCYNFLLLLCYHNWLTLFKVCGFTLHGTHLSLFLGGFLWSCGVRWSIFELSAGGTNCHPTWNSSWNRQWEHDHPYPQCDRIFISNIII